jgi:V/A-type H+-transporting ATPase subunit E
MEADLSLQALLDKIKQEGIDEAGRAAEKTLNEARSRADAILKNAQERAERILTEAEAEAEKRQEAFETAMHQAGRNLILSFEREVIKICRVILERELTSALTAEFMKQMVLKMMDRWQEHGDSDSPGLEILLNDKDRKELEELLLKSLQEEMRRGLILKPVKEVKAGFLIGEKDGSMHYDLTEAGMAEILAAYLNPRIARFLRERPREKQDQV